MCIFRRKPKIEEPFEIIKSYHVAFDRDDVAIRIKCKPGYRLDIYSITGNTAIVMMVRKDNDGRP